MCMHVCIYIYIYMYVLITVKHVISSMRVIDLMLLLALLSLFVL